MLSIQTLKDRLDHIKVDLNLCSSYPAPQQSTNGNYSSDTITSDIEQVAELCPYKFKIVTKRLLSLAQEAYNSSLNLLKSQQHEVPATEKHLSEASSPSSKHPSKANSAINKHPSKANSATKHPSKANSATHKHHAKPKSATKKHHAKPKSAPKGHVTKANSAITTPTSLKTSPFKASLCTLCPVKKPHYISNCNNLVWFNRINPVPLGANDLCIPHQWCYAKNDKGDWCRDKGHFTEYCDKYEYRVRSKHSVSLKTTSTQSDVNLKTTSTQSDVNLKTT